MSEVSKGYAIELQYAGGRISEGVPETSPNDPLEIQLSPSFAWLLLLALAASQPPAWRCRSSTRATARPCSPKVSLSQGGDAHLRRSGRIRKVTGNAGEFVLEKDDEKARSSSGRSPGQHQAHQPLRQHGRSTDRLLLQPVDTPSDAIVIREARDAVTRPARIRAQRPSRAHDEEPPARDGRGRCPTTWRCASPGAS